MDAAWSFGRMVSGRFKVPSPLLAGALLLVGSGLPSTRAEGPAGGAQAPSAEPRQLIPDFLDRFHVSGPESHLGPEGERRAQALLQYYRGTRLERAGKVDDALDAYETALKFAPSHLPLAAKASELAGQYGDSARGLVILETAHRLNPDRPEASILLSEFLSTYHDNRRENIERSLAVMEEASRRFPAAVEVQERLIVLHMMRRDLAAAEAVLAQALARDIPDPRYWLEMARVAQRLKGGEEDAALPEINSIYEQALARSGGDLEVETAVADHYRMTRQLDRAEELYLRIIRNRPDALSARERLAGVYALKDQPDKVLATLLDLERINPHRLETQKSIAGLYFEQAQRLDDERKPAEAKQAYANSVNHFLKSFRISKGEVREYILVARMQQYSDRPDDAVELLQRARFHYPDEIPLAIALAESLSAAKRYGEAVESFRATEKISQELRPDLLDDQFYFSYGAAAERNKQFDEAANLFRKAIDLAPADGEPHRTARALNYLGYMWLEQNRNIEEAGNLIQRANDLMPDEGAFVDSLGWYHFLAKDYRKALFHLLRASQLMDLDHPENAVVLDHLAQTYFQLGHQEEAIRLLERALVAEPGNADFRQRLESFRTGPAPERVPLDFLPPGVAPNGPEAPAAPEPPRPAPPAV
jgi:tetratricopeptide (TPR) repeat protein